MPTDPFQPFSTDPNKFWGRYTKWQDLVVEHFHTSAEASGMGRAEAEAILRTAPSNADLFSSIPYDITQKLKDRFREDVLGFSSGYIKHSWQEIGKGGGGNFVGRFVPRGDAKKTVGDHPLGYLLRRMSIQRDKTSEGIEDYTFGRNIPRVEHLRNLYNANGKGIEAGKKVFVFDTETLGLSTDASSVREVSGLTMTRGANGFDIDTASLMTSHMNVSRSAYGAIKDPITSKIVRMDNYIRKSIVGGTSFEHTVGGEGFIKGVLPILQQMNSADYIAGHNVGFDIGQVITNAMKTSDYLNNKVVDGVNVKSLVDSIADKIGKGGVIDSLHMASEYFGNNLKLAPEFAKTGRASAFSLENIMLQTNLSSLIKSDDPEFYKRFMSAGQHQADVDTNITAKLIDYISSGRLKAGTMTDKVLRRNTLTSYALTPISNIADPSHITKELFQQLAAEGGDSLTIRKIGTGGKVPITDAGAWYDRLTAGDNDHFASMKVTPMEQHIVSGQRVFDEVDEPASLVSSLGQWSRLSKYGVKDEGFLNRMHTLFKGGYIPDDDVFGDFQKSMAKSGMPFAGISMEERVLTAGLATSSRRRSTLRDMFGDGEQRVVDYGDDLGVSRFAMRHKFQTAFSGPAAIPLDVLKSAESAKVIGTSFLSDDVQMLSLSTIEGKQGVNLMADLSRKDTENLMDWMGKILEGGRDNPVMRQTLMDRGLDLASLGRMKSSLLDEGNWEHGINIGVLEGEAGKQAYGVMKDLLQDSTRDSTKIPFRVGYMNDSLTGEKGEGVIRTGAAILDRFKSADAKRAYARDLKVAESRTAKLTTELSDPLKRARASLNGYSSAERIAAKSDQIYDIVTKKAPVVAGLAALVFGGYYIHTKHERQETYDASLDPMPIQSGGRRPPRYFPPAASDQSGIDPLTYAGVVGNLNNNAIGHTQMGSRKHRGLFSGVG